MIMQKEGIGVTRRKLQHACAVVQPRRTFLHHLFELQAFTKKDHHHISFRGAAKSDIIWWNTFPEIEQWCLAHSSSGIKASLTPHLMDAAGSVGCGTV